MTEQQGTPEQATKRAQMDAILGRFDFDQRDHQQQWRVVQDQVPSRLHHYTTIDGLVGIAGSNALWASDVRFMNDSSELTYAATLIDEVISEVFSEVADGSLQNALPNREGVANGFSYGARPFIACFCERDDLLSQWRGYGAGQAPVSLGFDLSSLSRFNRLPPRTFLRKVEYNEAVQRQAVRDIVRTWLRTIESLADESDGPGLGELLPYPGIWALERALAEHHLCFKHPAFAEEQEWRLIKLVDVREELQLLNDRRREDMLAATRQRMQDLGVDWPEHSTAWSTANAEGVAIKFRRSALGLVPYVELELRDFAGVFAGQLPLWQVRQGPTSQPELAMESLRMFLESKGYGFHTEVTVSGIPLRP